MKANVKQTFEPPELKIKFETLEELQAFEVIFYRYAITDALPKVHTDKEFLKK